MFSTKTRTKTKPTGRSALLLKFVALLCSVAAVASAQVYTFSTFAGAEGFSSGGSTDGLGTAARFQNPAGMAVDRAGNLYVADEGNHTIRKITPSGAVSTLAGLAGASGSADGQGAAARFFFPRAVAVDAAGNVFVCDGSNYTIRKISPAGDVTTLAGTVRVQGGVDGTGSAAQFYFFGGIACDSTGTLYVADAGNQAIRKITSAGVVTTLAGALQPFPGGEGSVDGTGRAARFNDPQDVAVDGAGNVLVADTSNQTIRKVTPEGVVTTIAGVTGVAGEADGNGRSARFGAPSWIRADGAGNFFIADFGGARIRKMNAAGDVVTIGGGLRLIANNVGNGTGGGAKFVGPNGVAADTAGNVYVADQQIIRRGVPAPTASAARMANLSVRASTGGTLGSLVVGFTLSGSGTKPLLVRAIGPTLASFNVPGALPDPTLRIDRAGTGLVATNDDWGGGSQLAAMFAQVGAFALPETSKDAALLPTLGAGGYTAQVAGGSGAVLAEFYDPASDASPHVTNLSCLMQTGAANSSAALAGLVITGDGYKTLVIRAAGPALAQFGVSGALTQPQLELHSVRSDVAAGLSQQLSTANAWNDDPGFAAAFVKTGAFPFPAGSKDAALIYTLPAGTYLVSTYGSNVAAGAVLLEFYELP